VSCGDGARGAGCSPRAAHALVRTARVGTRLTARARAAVRLEPLRAFSQCIRVQVTFGQGLVDSVYLNAPEYVELDVGTGAPRSNECTTHWSPRQVTCSSITAQRHCAHFVELSLQTLRKCCAGAAVSITSTGWSDCVVWNPYKGMECYREFVCVENAQFAKPVTLAPGKDWRATTVMDVVDL
jgi:hypothetical protein